MARIFFVDDDPITLQILGKAAQLLGHEPVLIDSGREVFPLLETNKPDLVMTDMMMPDFDGMSILTKIRTDPELAHIPVVILSAGASPDDHDRVMAAGAQAYLSKPISLNVLLDTIRKFT